MQELGLSATSEPSRAGHRVLQRAEVRTIGRLTRDVRLERCCDIAQPRTPEHLRRSPCRRDGISRVILLYPPSASGAAAAVNDLHGCWIVATTATNFRNSQRVFTGAGQMFINLKTFQKPPPQTLQCEVWGELFEITSET